MESFQPSADINQPSAPMSPIQATPDARPPAVSALYCLTSSAPAPLHVAASDPLVSTNDIVSASAAPGSPGTAEQACQGSDARGGVASSVFAVAASQSNNTQWLQVLPTGTAGAASPTSPTSMSHAVHQAVDDHSTASASLLLPTMASFLGVADASVAGGSSTNNPMAHSLLVQLLAHQQQQLPSIGALKLSPPPALGAADLHQNAVVHSGPMSTALPSATITLAATLSGSAAIAAVTDGGVTSSNVASLSRFFAHGAVSGPEGNSIYHAAAMAADIGAALAADGAGNDGPDGSGATGSLEDLAASLSGTRLGPFGSPFTGRTGGALETAASQGVITTVTTEDSGATDLNDRAGSGDGDNDDASVGPRVPRTTLLLETPPPYQVASFAATPGMVFMPSMLIREATRREFERLLAGGPRFRVTAQGTTSPEQLRQREHRRLFVSQLPFALSLLGVQAVMLAVMGRNRDVDDVTSTMMGGSNAAAAAIDDSHFFRWEPSAKNNVGYTGCAFLRVSHMAAQSLILLSKRIMFDSGGVWLATTEAAQAAMADFCEMMKHRPARLRGRDYPWPTPFSAVSIELQRGAGIDDAPHHHNQQQQDGSGHHARGGRHAAARNHQPLSRASATVAVASAAPPAPQSFHYAAATQLPSGRGPTLVQQPLPGVHGHYQQQYSLQLLPVGHQQQQVYQVQAHQQPKIVYQQAPMQQQQQQHFISVPASGGSGANHGTTSGAVVTQLQQYNSQYTPLPTAAAPMSYAALPQQYQQQRQQQQQQQQQPVPLGHHQFVTTTTTSSSHQQQQQPAPQLQLHQMFTPGTAPSTTATLPQHQQQTYPAQFLQQPQHQQHLYVPQPLSGAAPLFPLPPQPLQQQHQQQPQIQFLYAGPPPTQQQQQQPQQRADAPWAFQLLPPSQQHPQ